MNQRESRFDSQNWRSCVSELRNEQPRDEAVESAVRSFAIPTPNSSGPKRVWLLPTSVTVTTAATIVGLLFLRPQSALAELRAATMAIRAQKVRHTVTYRPASGGQLELANEMWVAGNRHCESYVKEHAKTIYDGRRLFLCRDGKGTIDEVESESPPIEDLTAYYGIPGGKLTAHLTGRHVAGKSVELFRMEFPDVRFDLYIDPRTHLPLLRDVLSHGGRLIEENLYDYPNTLPDHVFEPPSEIRFADYPALRSKLAMQLRSPGQTTTIHGVEVRLKAVLVGKQELVALWTGGDRAGDLVSGALRINRSIKPVAIQRTGFLAYDTQAARFSNLPAETRGDGAYFSSLSDLPSKFQLTFTVWGKGAASLGSVDRPHPIGEVMFDVRNAIYVDDPTAILNRASISSVGKASTAKDL